MNQDANRAWVVAPFPRALTARVDPIVPGCNRALPVPDVVVIASRFRGPPDSANGGYAAAMAAQFIDGPAEVTLRSPPPLARPLRVELTDEGVALRDDDELIVEARPTTVDIHVPAPVPLRDARRASSRYPWREDHPYPTCFVCGPQREEGDGLRIFPGPVDDGSMYAAPWLPDRSVAHDDGTVRTEFVWAALDCPSGIVTDLFGDVGLILLGRIAADITHSLEVGSSYVLQSWPVGRDGRKLTTGSAIFSTHGELCAVARATWIELRAE